MRKRTLAALVLFWSMLSAVMWASLEPTALDWITPRLAGFDPHTAQLIATVAADALPLVVAGLVVWFMVLLARPATQERSQRPAVREAPAAPSTASHATSKIISIKPDKTLVHSGLRFGLLRVADAKNQARHDEEIYFKKLSDRGALMARVPYDARRGFQFKCFVDYKGTKFERVKSALSASGYKSVTPKAGPEFRAWFLLPNYRVSKTTEGQAANIVRPG